MDWREVHTLTWAKWAGLWVPVLIYSRKKRKKCCWFWLSTSLEWQFCRWRLMTAISSRNACQESCFVRKRYSQLCASMQKTTNIFSLLVEGGGACRGASVTELHPENSFFLESSGGFLMFFFTACLFLVSLCLCVYSFTFICASVRLSLWLPVCSFITLSLWESVSLSQRQSICLSVWGIEETFVLLSQLTYSLYSHLLQCVRKTVSKALNKLQSWLNISCQIFLQPGTTVGVKKITTQVSFCTEIL